MIELRDMSSLFAFAGGVEVVVTRGELNRDVAELFAPSS